MNIQLSSPVWYPGETGYKEHLDRYYLTSDIISSIKKQSLQINKSIVEQSYQNKEYSTKIIASNEQITASINEGFNRLSDINERGFSRVSSAIEDLNSDMILLLGTIIQKLEYQNKLLSGILTTLQEPFETKVKEYYRKGCLFIQQGFLEGAIDCFKESISLKMGEYFFPSYYQLGRIYLSGVSEGINFTEPKTATKYLLKANEFGNRILKADPSFSPILADCKFYLSQSYYFQISGNKNSNELDLLNNAINYCKEAIDINPNLSQGWYHIAKYKSYRMEQNSKTYLNSYEIEDTLIYFLRAIEKDRNYLRAIKQEDFLYDKAFKHIEPDILKLVNRLTAVKKKDATLLISKADNYFKVLEEKNIKNSKYYDDYKKLNDTVLSAKKDFDINTYFGFDDCIIKLKQL